MKDRKSSIAIIVAVVLIFGYIFYEFYTVTNVKMITQTAVTSTVYKTIESSALIIRNEKIITTNKSGVIVPSVSDGDKVGVNGKIAKVFSSSTVAENYSSIVESQKQLRYYSSLENRSSAQVTDIESMERGIITELNDYVRNCSNNNLSKSKTNISELNDLFTRRQLLIGENIDFKSINEELQTKISKLTSNSYKPTSEITTDKSGYFASYVDGCEGLVDYDNVQDLTIENFNKYVEKVETQKTPKALGKLIFNYRWYMATVIDCNKIENLKNGDTVEVCLKDDSNKILQMEVVSGADFNIGQEKTLLVLKCNQLTSDLTSLRLEDIEIRLQSFKGIRVPTTAIHVVDGKKGVYVLVSNQVKLREVEVIYTADDFVVVKYDPDKSDGIILYDQIITQGKGLEDGTIYN